MELIDSRRLTGPNPLTDGPAATIDVLLAGADPDAFEVDWRTAVFRLTDALGWPRPATHRYDLPDALSLALTGIPEDQLYAATEINDWAWSQLSGQPAPESEHGLETFDEALARIRVAADEERNDGQQALIAAAAEHGVTLLWDDDEVSLGLGASAQVWPARELPDPDALDWSRYADLPIGMITGTNGKSTTARYAAAIMAAAGRTVGLSSTDWIRAGEEILDRGDYSGPGGARAVLRHASVDAVILETARGGLRRRGLGIARADAAVITNVAEDHLGDFGVPDVPALLEIKWAVSKAVRSDGVLILNADDPLLVERSREHPGRLAWFSLEPARVADAALAATVEDGELLLREGDDRCPLLPAADVAMTVGGRARHNLANALAAALLCQQLGCDADAIAMGLRAARDDDNPGRLTQLEVGGATVLCDFAHNPHGLEALFQVAREVPARRRLLLIGQAGDRRDEDIRALADEAWELGLDRVIIKEMAVYRRGREPGEVPAILRQAFLAAGADEAVLSYCETELEAAAEAVAWLQDGDLAVLLVHEDIEAVVSYLRERADATG